MHEFDAKTFLANLPTNPGVYRMLDAGNKVLYVGKARNLKHRVGSYFRANLTEAKTRALMQEVKNINVTITHSENEALLLESNLIKQLKPRYNILLRDDKSYPYLFLSSADVYPRLDIHRGPHKLKGDYFGPYPSAASVHETLDLLQKIFKIRQCSDNFFNNRTRPCLQYQIKRCTAPCVDYITPEDYAENVRHAVLFLQGKNTDILQALTEKMEAASSALAFEEASRYRDQIVSLRRIQEQQYVDRQEGDVDVIAIKSEHGIVCLHILFIRNGRLLGNKSYFPATPLATQEEEVLTAFLPQYYLSETRGEAFPKRVVLNIQLKERQWIKDAITEQIGKKMTIHDQVRGHQRKWLEMAMMNAKHALNNYLVNKMHFQRRLEALQEALELSHLPQRLECFDISHTMGEATIASCVVFNQEGPLKRDYRRFNITNITQGDDYAAMKQALTRRYTRLKAGEGALPDILLIDGGKGQLSQAEAVLETLQITDIILIGIAKGPTRKPGFETLFVSGKALPLNLPADSIAFHLLQQIRDEAHRFAISGHRKQRAKARMKSPLEEIAGIGAKRRRELLNHFGGMQEVKRASADEIAKVPGISRDLAQRIFDSLH